MNILSLILRGTRELGPVTLWDSVTHLIRKRWYQVRFARNRRTRASDSSDYLRPGPVTSHAHQGQTVTITCANGSHVLTILAPDLIRVRFQPANQPSAPLFSYSIAKSDAEWPSCDFHIIETEAAIEIRTPRLVCQVVKASGRLAFLDLEGTVVNEDEAGTGWHSSGQVICHKRIQPDEHFYGLGERTFGLDLRGRRYGMWNTDPHTYQLGQDPIHLCMPVLLGLHSQGRQGYGIFFDNTFRGWFDLGAKDPHTASFGAEGGKLCYYFVYGPVLTTVVERYTELTGRIMLPPLWMLGYHQSRWSYHPEARVRKLAADFRQVYHVPCDGIHLDIHYMDGYRCFTWDPKRFPHPAKKIADLHEQGFKIIVIIDPGIKADPRYRVCQDGLEQDVFCKYPDGKTLFKGPVWPGDCYFPDFTNPRVREWWGDLYKVLTDIGVDGIWNDMNEPAIFGLQSTTFPDFVQHDLEGRGGAHIEAHNVYGMQMARATAEGLMKLRPDERPVCITRSGWAGVQRCAMSWTGDNRSNWSHLWLSMPMLMNLGLCGLAHTGPDIGGFSRFATGELFTRWLQMGIFLPFLRSHTFVHSPDQEPWSWGEPYLSINRSYIELRYRLLPYLYTAFWQCTQTGLPIVRPLLLAFQDDTVTPTLDDQFMCGDAFLVAPVIEAGATCRSLYLPAGVWYDFWTDEQLSGPVHVEVEAPLERLPLFVRAGSVVPMAPPMQYVGERPVDSLTLHVYPSTSRCGEPVEPSGQAPSTGGCGEHSPEQSRRAVQPSGHRPSEGESRLYEDDGCTWAFRDGEYRLTRFALSTNGSPLSWLDLHRQVEGCYKPEYQDFEVIIHGVDRLPRTALADGQPIDQCELDVGSPAIRLYVGLFEHLTVEWT